MARRRQEKSLVAVLVAAPWQASLVVAIISFVAMRWLLPSILGAAPVFSVLAVIARQLAWLPLVFFAFIGLLAFVRTLPAAAGPRGQDKGAAYQQAEPLFTPVTPRRAIQAGWGRSSSAPMGVACAPLDAHAWSIDALHKLEWKRFELLCARYYETIGFRALTQQSGPDGGIDVTLCKGELDSPIAIVQCKAWIAKPVGVKEVRELRGVMAHKNIRRGIFITNGTYTADALIFGEGSPIQLLNGTGFVKKIAELSLPEQETLWKFAFSGDYSTPTCASCGIKMIKKDSKNGVFWGCENFPRCRNKFSIK